MMTMVEAALAYHRRGWRVIQLYGVNPKTGVGCTCRKGADCTSIGKHPVDSGWQKASRMTEDEIQTAWSGWRATFNVGLAAGPDSGWFALDIDVDKGGRESIERLQKEYAPLEVSCASQTGGDGWHLLMALPEDFTPTNRTGGLKEYAGLDVRGLGGQIVAPPSVTDKGSYRWLKSDEPGPAPEWLLELLRPTSTPPPAPAAAKVVPLQMSDEETTRVEAYATTVRDLEVARLTAMREAATPDGVNYQGENWNEGTFHVACSLLELANSDWTVYDRAAAESDLFAHAPRDAGFGADDVAKCYKSALTRVGDNGRAYPTQRPTDDVWSWLDDPDLPRSMDADKARGEKPPEGAVITADQDVERHPTFTWDDLGNGMRVEHHFGKTIKWVLEAEQWAVFRKGRWQLVKPNVVQGYVQRMFDELVEATEATSYSNIPDDPEKPEDTPRASFLKWLKMQRMSARIEAAQKEARGRHGLHVSMADFDADPLKLNVANGVVDLETGRLLPAHPDLMMMRQSPVAYDATASAPLWQAFLERVQPDEQMRQYLQRASGYSVTGDVTEQAFFIHHGDGANGKSIWSGIVGTILGEYGQVVAPSTLLANTQDEHPTGVAMMQGKRWLPATETAPGRRLDEEKVKNLTGDAQVTARFMGKDFFEFEPTGKIHLITNHLPFLSDAKSIWRRIHLIKWGVTIPEAEQDRRLEMKLRAELPGILAWLVRGALAWQEQGLNPPQAALDDLAVYRGDSDAFGDFLRERTMPAPDMKTPTAALYRAYTNWAFDQGIRKPMTQQSFVAAMAERKYERYRDAGSRGFVGIAPLVQTIAVPWEESA